MSTEISVENPAMTLPAMKAIPTGGATGASGNGVTAAGTSAEVATPVRWTPADSARTYGIDHWGQGYFSVTPEGTVAVHPTVERDRKIDLKKLVDELRERDIQLPMLLRFTDILKHRVSKQYEAFDKAIREN